MSQVPAVATVQELCCADCRHYVDSCRGCTITRSRQSAARHACSEFEIEPLARLGGGTPYSRSEDETPFGGYRATRMDHG